MGKFQVRYYIEDGYVGSRPQYFNIQDGDVVEDMNEDDLSRLYDELVEEDFQANKAAYGDNKEDFIEWAKELIESYKDIADDD